MAKMRPDQKKGFPGGFLLFLLAAVLVILGIQTFTADRSAHVSFSHQVEHLTNLNLTIPEENRKIAQNENLVTFSGRFRERVPEESTERYRYLELLNQNHELKGESHRLTSELDQLQKNVQESADLYLHINGQNLPRAGFTVIGSAYDTPERNSAITIKNLSNSEVASVPYVQKTLNFASQMESADAVDNVGKEIRDLLSLLRSPALGIGTESIKSELKTLDYQITSAVEDRKSTRLNSSHRL